MSYVDTSAIVAALDSDDPRRAVAIATIEARGVKVISELVLLELACTLSRRRWMLEDLARSLAVEARGTLVPATLLYIMRRFGLRYARVEGVGSYHFVAVSKPFSKALRLSNYIDLRTLDLLHLAYLDALREQGEDLRELITADEDFAREAEKIEEHVGVKVTCLSVS